MSSDNERRLILQMIDSGKISAEDGLQLLQALPSSEAEGEEEQIFVSQPSGFSQPPVGVLPAEISQAAGIPTAEPIETGGRDFSSDSGHNTNDESGLKSPGFNRWRRYWIIPLWIGVGITIGGSLLMLWAAQTSGLGFWFLCAVVPFAFGVLILALAWQSRTARWLHLRVQQKPGEWPRTIAFSFPLPLRISSWFMRTFRRYIPGMEDVSVDKMLASLETSTSPENPLYIEVEEDDGERVQIFIG